MANRRESRKVNRLADKMISDYLIATKSPSIEFQTWIETTYDVVNIRKRFEYQWNEILEPIQEELISLFDPMGLNDSLVQKANSTLVQILYILAESKRKESFFSTLVAMLRDRTDHSHQHEFLDMLIHFGEEHGLWDFEMRESEFEGLTTVVKARFIADVEFYDAMAKSIRHLPMIIKPEAQAAKRNNRGVGYCVSNRTSVITGDGHHDEYINRHVLDILNQTPMRINHSVWVHFEPQFSFNSVLEIVRKAEAEGRTLFVAEVMNNEKYTLNDKKRQHQQLLELIGDNPVYFLHSFDTRSRIYAKGYALNYQGESREKAEIEFAERSPISDEIPSNIGSLINGALSDVDNLKVDIANHFGKDKEDFNVRIEWFNAHLVPRMSPNITDEEIVHLVQELEAEEKELAFVALQAYRQYLNGEDSGYPVSFDATASGVQIMTATTLDMDFAWAVNIGSQHRYDPYTALFDVVKPALEKAGIKVAHDLTRADIKAAVMTFFYGATYGCMKKLGCNMSAYEPFYNAMVSSKGARHATILRDVLIHSRRADQMSYRWTMPNGHTVRFNVTKRYEESRKLSSGKRVTYHYVDKGINLKFLSLAANVIHSIDGFVLAELIALCNYDPALLDLVLDVVENRHEISPTQQDYTAVIFQHISAGVDAEFLYIFNQIRKTGFVTVAILPFFNNLANVRYMLAVMGKDEAEELFQKIETMVYAMRTYKPFPIIAVHDCFRCHPSNMNVVRYWYAEILAKIVECDVLGSILEQLPNGTRYYNEAFSEEIADKELRAEMAQRIRNSIYLIC